MSVALYARVSSVFGNQPDRHSLKGGIHVTSPGASWPHAASANALLPTVGGEPDPKACAPNRAGSLALTPPGRPWRNVRLLD